MAAPLPQIYLARHGETAWSITGQHTGRSDLALTPWGERNSERLGERLKGISFEKVYTSPLQRAKQTCELAGFGAACELDPQLMEWDYGNYEGLTTAEIQKERPGWNLFADGCPDGENIEDAGLRADAVVTGLRKIKTGYVLLFSHAHFLRVLTARWLLLEPAAARCLVLSPTSLSILGYEHNLAEPVIKLWNEVSHLAK